MGFINIGADSKTILIFRSALSDCCSVIGETLNVIKTSTYLILRRFVLIHNDNNNKKTIPPATLIWHSSRTLKHGELEQKKKVPRIFFYGIAITWKRCAGSIIIRLSVMDAVICSSISSARRLKGECVLKV